MSTMNNSAKHILVTLAILASIAINGCSEDSSPVAPTAPAAPVPMLDANFEPTVQSVFSVIGDTDKAIVFTVLQTGTLDRVELLLSAFPSSNVLLIDIRRTVNGVPVNDDAAVSAVTLVQPPDTSATGVWFKADLKSSQLAVTMGEVLAISAQSAGAWTMIGTFSDADPASTGYFRNPGQSINTWTVLGFDVGFRVYATPDS